MTFWEWERKKTFHTLVTQNLPAIFVFLTVENAGVYIQSAVHSKNKYGILQNGVHWGAVGCDAILI